MDIDDDELTPESWMQDARCAEFDDPDLFFSNRSEDIMVVRKVCEKCPVRFACAEYAIENQIEDGVWGGLSESDRAFIRKQKKAQSRKGIRNKQH